MTSEVALPSKTLSCLCPSVCAPCVECTGLCFLHPTVINTKVKLYFNAVYNGTNGTQFDEMPCYHLLNACIFSSEHSAISMSQWDTFGEVQGVFRFGLVVCCHWGHCMNVPAKGGQGITECENWKYKDSALGSVVAVSRKYYSALSMEADV